MHGIKGVWVGQTFALAKYNDSGGRKSRIRRSKEERKAMVESFIKKYQKSNNGNFPSLNLTHKEVGGSFYTVRELVREIIQENRVLGPAKLTPEEQNTDWFSEQHPLGSISTEPQVHLSFSSNGTHVVINDLGTSEELVLNASGQCTGPDHQIFDNGRTINGSHADEKNKESDELIYTELQVGETLDTDKNGVEELEASPVKVINFIEDVIVETFPLRPFMEPTFSLDGSSSEVRDMTGTLEEKENQKKELATDNCSSVSDQSSLENCFGLADEKAMANLAGPLLESNPGLGEEKAMLKLGDPSLERSNFSTTKEGIPHDIQDGTDLGVEVSHNVVLTSETLEQGQQITGIKPIIAPNGMHTKNIGGTNSSGSVVLDSEEEMVVENKVDVQHSGGSQEGSKPTLDRINLESWDGASKKSAEPEANPLLAFFKSFMAAFVKFWSE